MKSTLNLDFTNKASNVTFEGEDVVKVWGSGLGWTEQEAREVLEDHTRYLANLRTAGINTSTILSREIRQGGTGYTIRETESNLGPDVSSRLIDSTNEESVMEKTNKYFRSIAALLLSIPPKLSEQYSKRTPWLSVPVDLKPQNVVIDEDSLTPTVIDTFGPKLWLGQSLKKLPTRTPGKGQTPHDEIKVGDVRFSLGRLNGYFMALSTRWLINGQPEMTPEQIDDFRAKVANITASATASLLRSNTLFDNAYAHLLISDAAEKELASIKLGKYEGPRYVQSLYEQEELTAPARNDRILTQIPPRAWEGRSQGPL